VGFQLIHILFSYLFLFVENLNDGKDNLNDDKLGQAHSKIAK
jgi:hypothetical protein